MSNDAQTPETPVHLREVLATLPDYAAGKPPTQVPGLTPYKLSSNENPYPPLPSVAAAIATAATRTNRYPDAGNSELTQRLAAYLHLDPGVLTFGTGSVDVLAKILTVTCEPGDEVVYAWRSFEAYPIVTALAGATAVPVPVTADGRHDLDAMLDAVTGRTRVVLLCTPNNPTGPALTQAQVDDFLARCPEHVLVVIDEAYLEFATDDEVVRGVPTWQSHANVVLLRTFSKAHGLAALRIGYAVAHPPVAAALRKAATPFGVNLIAQAAAVASLDATEEMRERVAGLVAERRRVTTALADQGWRLPATQANFVWFPLGDEAAAFGAACDARGLSVRVFAGDGVRVSIAEPEANSRLLEIAQSFGPR